MYAHNLCKVVTRKRNGRRLNPRRFESRLQLQRPNLYTITRPQALRCAGHVRHSAFIYAKHHTDLFEHHSEFVELGDDAFPVDASRPYDVIQLEDDMSVVEVTVQVTDVRRHAHRVHPVTIHWPANKHAHINSCRGIITRARDAMRARN